MADLRQLKDRASDLAARGKFDRAAEAWREVVAADPRDVASRHKLAEALRRAGRDEEAVAAFRAVADRYARDGLLIKAIAVCKVVLEIDPGHGETQQMLADLYARRLAPGAQPLTEAPAPPPPREDTLGPDTSGGIVLVPLAGGGTGVEPVPEPSAGGAEPLPAARRPAGVDLGAATPYEAILGAAGAAPSPAEEEEAVLEEEREPTAEVTLEPVLPRIPLFSDLAPPAFVALTQRMALRRAAAGETVLRQGEPGDRFYVVASGRFRVERRDELGQSTLLARLGEGAFFGEMALLTGEPRSASVVAEEEGELLEITAEALARLVREHPHVADSLRRFYRQRLLANALATSAVFRPLGVEERRAVLRRFRARDVAPGARIIAEGAPSDGLYVVLSGTLDVLKRKGSSEVLAARLREGDVFGEMSCLSKQGATATVVVRRGGTLLRLPRSDFDELVLTYPQVLERVAELSEERAESLDAILAGYAAYTEDGLVLI